MAMAFARYPGLCPNCAKPIKVRDVIDWRPGSRAMHLNCDAVQHAPSEPVSRPTRRLTPTDRWQPYSGQKVRILQHGEVTDGIVMRIDGNWILSWARGYRHKKSYDVLTEDATLISVLDEHPY